MGKQIFRKSIINLCFASSSIAAERYMERVFGGWSLLGGLEYEGFLRRVLSVTTHHQVLLQ